MQLINKLEKIVLEWAKNVPHLPIVAQKWLATNVWWIVLIGVILSGISTLIALAGLFTIISLIGSVSSSYYVTSAYNSWTVVTTVVSLIFSALSVVVLAFAITPLKAIQKKGWVLLFLSWLINVASIVVNAVLSLSIIGFIFSIMFGAIGLAIAGYFIFEIHGQFAHPTRKEPKEAKLV